MATSAAVGTAVLNSDGSQLTGSAWLAPFMDSPAVSIYAQEQTEVDISCVSHTLMALYFATRHREVPAQ